MRHQNKVKKLQRTSAQRKALISGLVSDLITHKQIKTTLAKAKAIRPFAEKMVTLAKRNDLHARRMAVAFLRSKSVVSELFDVVAPLAEGRPGGYTRIYKLTARKGDAAETALIELVAKDDKSPAMTPKAKTARKPKAKKEAAAAPAQA
jgi:large subunit ribosomal protein L17